MNEEMQEGTKEVQKKGSKEHNITLRASFMLPHLYARP